MVNKISLQFLLLLLTMLLTQVAYADKRTELEQQINQLISDEELVGIVWSTLSNGSVNIGSAGFSNKSQNQRMRHSQKMHVGSVTKTVLALGTLRLITEGKLSLNTQVAPLLSGLAFNNTWQDTAPITVKNLLEHTAGLDNIRMWQFLNTTPTPDTPLNHAFPSSNNKLLTTRTKPGTQYSYSNMSYALLAMVIEAVTLERYEHYLDKNFLEPVGMSHSTFEYVSQTGPYADEALAMGYFENNVSQTAVPSYLRPAGQFTTTAADMAQFVKFIFNDGVLNGKPFIHSSLLKKIGYPSHTEAEKAGLKIGHGLAFATRDRHGVLGMCHPGTTIGFRAYICLFPEEKKAFFYSINTDNETANYEKFNALFINHLSIEKTPVAPVNDKLMDLTALEGLYLPAPNNMAEFEWLDLMFNFKWLTRDKNRLVMKSLQSNDRVLLPINDTLLRATDRALATHAIITHENGDVYISNGLSTYKKHPALTIIAYWCSLVLGLIGLIYILLVGSARVITRQVESQKVIFWPLVNIVTLSMPIFLYTSQSFLMFGELTAASFSLAVITGLLPVTCLVSLYIALRNHQKSTWAKWDCVALLLSLQLWLVLLYWGVIPSIFWR